MAHRHAAGHYAGCQGDCNGRCELRRYLYITAIVIPLCIFECVMSRVAGSASLAADAAHLLMDNGMIFVILGAKFTHLRGWRAEAAQRAGKRALYALLTLSVALLCIETARRWASPEVADGRIVMTAATVVGCGNYAVLRLLQGTPHEHRDALHAGYGLHVLADLWVSCAVVIGGAVTYVTRVVFIDPVISLIVITWIFGQILILVGNDRKRSV